MDLYPRCFIIRGHQSNQRLLSPSCCRAQGLALVQPPSSLHSRQLELEHKPLRGQSDEAENNGQYERMCKAMCAGLGTVLLSPGSVLPETGRGPNINIHTI